ncbi:TadE/TadG family type IV pilus assembly protein [Pelagibacterium limicola]|uniref:TadE/TadG family type IV pilus assembly protein n=1 Tax=Pelagibacterium limicola TaxID=2791022 RepID=UPI0018AF5790|nr:TadE/TadG family type IV pilus assembly protein [Pelagibacterium limicola]
MRSMKFGFLADDRGVAATEFALLVPILLTLLLGTIEISNFTLQNRRAHQAAVLAAEFMSRDGDNVLAINERHIVEDIWMITNPTAHLAMVPRDGRWANGYSRALASVEFAPVGNCQGLECPLFPRVNWTFLYQDIISRPVYTRCELELVPNSVPLDGKNIHDGLVGRAPVVVVHFTYPYIPLLQGWLFPTLELHASAVRKTRNSVLLRVEQDGFTRSC